MRQPGKFVVACGGTGGHAFPGLAVAVELRRRGHSVEVWMSGRAIEAQALRDWDGPVFSTGMRQLSLRYIPRIIRSCFRCWRHLRRMRPDVVLAMGSYSSLPPVMAAWVLRIPVCLHEANAIPGKAIDYLARFASTVAISFPEAARYLTSVKTVYTGFPVRRALMDQSRFGDIPAGSFVIFITGGSQGARSVNRLMVQAITLLKRDGFDSLYVIHQCGTQDEGALTRTYAEIGVPARVCAFLPEMGRAFASADLVVSRAGASTCFELAAMGVPALLIPLPSALRNHQHANAQYLVSVGAADEGIQAELTGRSLMRYIANKIQHPEQLAAMRAAMREIRPPAAAECVADMMESHLER